MFRSTRVECNHIVDDKRVVFAVWCGLLNEHTVTVHVVLIGVMNRIEGDIYADICVVCAINNSWVSVQMTQSTVVNKFGAFHMCQYI